MTSSKQPVTGRTRDVVIFADKAIFRLAKHWLALANIFWGLYVGLPLLAPVLMDAGMELPAKAIYLVYRPLCHQRPERSYFYGGEQLVYSAEELVEAGVSVGLLSRDIGNEAVGWKVAFCERDVAIYGAIFVTDMEAPTPKPCKCRRLWLTSEASLNSSLRCYPDEPVVAIPKKAA